MLSTIIDFEEEDAEVFFAMDDAEVEMHEDGGVSVVFEDYNSLRTIQVSIGPFLLAEIMRLKQAKETGCHYIEEPKADTPLPGQPPF